MIYLAELTDCVRKYLYLSNLNNCVTEKEEEAARAVRKDQNMLSVEDIKKDFVKVQEQTNYLEEKIVELKKLTDSTGIESRNKCNKLSNDLELLSEKVKKIY